MSKKLRSLRVEDQLWNQFQKKCEKKDIPISRMIRKLMKKYINDEIEEIENLKFKLNGQEKTIQRLENLFQKMKK